MYKKTAYHLNMCSLCCANSISCRTCSRKPTLFLRNKWRLQTCAAHVRAQPCTSAFGEQFLMCFSRLPRRRVHLSSIDFNCSFIHMVS